MNETQRTPLEEELAKMTTCTSEEATLWREALERTKETPAKRSILHSFTWRSPWMAAAMIAVLGSVVTLAFVVPQGRSQSDRTSSRMERNVVAPDVPPAASRPQRRAPDGNGSMPAFGSESEALLEQELLPPPPPPPPPPAAAFSIENEVSAQRPGDLTAQRFVIRTATIELAAEDVRGTYLRVMQIPSVRLGEYIDDSSLTGGEPGQLHGSVTLRVAADRLSEVLNELRELGRIVSEQSKADDATAQHVDLEARLRNEQRIEVELLELLSKRDDAPLKDVLELRRHLEVVRGQIERLTAHHDQLSRLVSLATILVIIRHDADLNGGDEPEQDALSSYFFENIHGAGKDGLYLLADTIAILVHVVIGGLIWWVIAFTLIITARAMWRRNTMAA